MIPDTYADFITHIIDATELDAISCFLFVNEKVKL